MKSLKALQHMASQLPNQLLTKQQKMLRTRFAPSPTGHLHLGHVASALCVNGLGRSLGFKPFLRIEDHDRGRARPSYEQAIIADLDWLEIPYDSAPIGTQSHAHPHFCRQSDDLTPYATALESLAAKNLIFGCDCSRKRLATISTIADPEADGQQELVYDGYCRERGVDWRQAGVGVRMRVEPQAVRFFDGFLGDQTQNPAQQCGDILLRDRHGHYTYQFAVSVDDMAQGVSLIIRGQDLLASTGRQLILAQALGRQAPLLWAHHPLLVDDSGRKLGKRFFSASISERRSRGDDPRLVIGEALWRLGLSPSLRETSVADAQAMMGRWLA